MHTPFELVVLFKLERFPEATLLLGQRDSISLTLINPDRLLSNMVEIIYNPTNRVCECSFPYTLASTTCYQSF